MSVLITSPLLFSCSIAHLIRFPFASHCQCATVTDFLTYICRSYVFALRLSKKTALSKTCQLRLLFLTPYHSQMFWVIRLFYNWTLLLYCCGNNLRTATGVVWVFISNILSLVFFLKKKDAMKESVYNRLRPMWLEEPSRLINLQKKTMTVNVEKIGAPMCDGQMVVNQLPKTRPVVFRMKKKRMTMR